MTEKELKELIELNNKNIKEGINEIIWILKALSFFGLTSIILVLIFSIFG